MPVIAKKNVMADTVIGLWEIKEDEKYFLDRITLSEEEKMQLSAIKGQRRVHWLCSRHLLHLITNQTIRVACLKDEFGKPHLHNTDLSISFSHSGDLVAVALSRHSVGIDIQHGVEKISRIRHKFVNLDESAGDQMTDMDHMHWVWGAKEAAFKAYGRKQVDFLKHMHFEYDTDETFSIDLEKEEERAHHFEGQLEQWGEYYLVYLIEKQTDEI